MPKPYDPDKVIIRFPISTVPEKVLTGIQTIHFVDADGNSVHHIETTPGNEVKVMTIGGMAALFLDAFNSAKELGDLLGDEDAVLEISVTEPLQKEVLGFFEGVGMEIPESLLEFFDSEE